MVFPSHTNDDLHSLFSAIVKPIVNVVVNKINCLMSIVTMQVVPFCVRPTLMWIVPGCM
jgi:hypothetical protein